MIIKSYTDIEQSKKLSEILSLESADMCLTFTNNVWNPVWGKAHDIYQLQKDCYEPDYTKDDYVDFDEFEPKVVPCWSLATLLKYLSEIKPQEYTPILFPTEGKWILQFLEYGHGNVWEVSCDNPVDACIKMILKLHKFNLI